MSLLMNMFYVWMMFVIRFFVFFSPFIIAVIAAGPMAQYCNNVTAKPKGTVTVKEKVLSAVFTVCILGLMFGAIIVTVCMGDDLINVVNSIG